MHDETETGSISDKHTHTHTSVCRIIALVQREYLRGTEGKDELFQSGVSQGVMHPHTHATFLWLCFETNSSGRKVLRHVAHVKNMTKGQAMQKRKSR